MKDEKYKILGIKFAPIKEVFCDEDGYVYMTIQNGIKTYYNDFNGYHSSHTIQNQNDKLLFIFR